MRQKALSPDVKPDRFSSDRKLLPAGLSISQRRIVTEVSPYTHTHKVVSGINGSAYGYHLLSCKSIWTLLTFILIKISKFWGILRSSLVQANCKAGINKHIVLTLIQKDFCKGWWRIPGFWDFDVSLIYHPTQKLWCVTQQHKEFRRQLIRG